MIRLIGYWKVSLDDEYPFAQELKTEYEPEIQRRLAAYLESGALLEQYRGLSQCRFCNANNGSKELYDGDWAWPEGLAHYLREHPVALPPDFIRHATSQPGPPRPSGDPEKRRAELDDSTWIEWARSHRTPVVAKMLEEARAAAARAYEAQLDAKAAEMAAQLGVGEAACGWAGCARRALAGKAICARHVVDKYDWIRTQVEFEELRKLIRKL